MKFDRRFKLSLRASILFVLFNIWLLTLYWLPNTIDVASNYFHFAFLGVLGAIFANSTGAGGGVVFIPTFAQLGFTELQSVATSFGIQCFGMTAGAITWWRFYRNEKQQDKNWQPFNQSIIVISLVSMVSIASTYAFDIKAPASLVQLFKVFSIVLGAIILVITLKLDTNNLANRFHLYDWIALVVIAAIGGVITAWLSVGVGELIAIYLILRRFDVVMAVAIAVIVSALTVWTAAYEQLLLGSNAYWNVILFAGPGAVVGGIAAKKLVNYLPAKHVKIFFALWVLIIGLLS